MHEFIGITDKKHGLWSLSLYFTDFFKGNIILQNAIILTGLLRKDLPKSVLKSKVKRCLEYIGQQQLLRV